MAWTSGLPIVIEIVGPRSFRFASHLSPMSQSSRMGPPALQSEIFDQGTQAAYNLLPRAHGPQETFQVVQGCRLSTSSYDPGGDNIHRMPFRLVELDLELTHFDDIVFREYLAHRTNPEAALTVISAS